ncbi:hypothetical protein [Streptomyces sp. NBC_01237]|uniref:hypothetical protein n=1 Tax=Streptomyces sp. NBC_01237 TaxID=2903790 RepID=UPI002DDACE61|nr:hypothetical protein [Streptomyces sp. NBC_01237]WRZ73018.1 hypothetical protein OG251_16035 [Streptomyces sp. NBC_01237]
MPWFRWVLALGLVLIAGSAVLYATAPGMPELKQIDLTVLDEKADGACTVRWTDPFDLREREGPYRCDAERDSILKAPNYDGGSGLGWDTGFVVAQGQDTGDLYSLDEDIEADDRIELSDTLVAFGFPLTVVGVVGGNISALARASGARPQAIRRARRLEEAAALVDRDHSRAVEAVRKAWAPVHEERVNEELSRIPASRLTDAAGSGLRAEVLETGGIRTVREVLDSGAWGLERLPGVEQPTAVWAVATARRIADDLRDVVEVRMDVNRPEPRSTALLVALRVLVEAGPPARNAAEAGRDLSVRLDRLLTVAAPASGWTEMRRAGRAERRRALAAVAELRLLLDDAERRGRAAQFAQASVDLLRGPDDGPAGLSAWVDFETRPAEYYGLLADIVGPGRE